ncbi:MAG: hypothetical protein NZ927_04700 [Candidatus Calescibacterium sp.]|nr:hypothetical protein [Candidatus Calescibacterium sp.]
MSAEMTFFDLLKVPEFILESLMVSGKTPDIQKLIGWEFRGHNVGIIPKMGRILKFKKGFRRSGDEVHGYNVLIKQNSPEEPWIALPSEINPKRHGFYKVYPAKFSPKYNHYPHALMLDYGKGGNPIYDPSQFLRDYLVKPFEDNDDLYLGKAYVELFGKLIPVGYFVIERYNKAEI